MPRLLFLAAFITSIAAAQTSNTPQLSSGKSDSLYLRVVIPDRDTIQTPSSRHRIAASTNPSARAFINGKEVKVYPSGAFVSLLTLVVGENPVRVLVESTTGDSLVKDYVFVRPEPSKPLPHEPAVIDPASVEPSQDRWLGKDDILEVRFKGSPGYEAYFDIEDVESGIPMTELTSKEGNGSDGIYIGRYKVKETDEVRDKPVRVRLKKSFWSSEKAYSKGKVTILPQELPRVAIVAGRKPFLNAGLGEDRLGGAKLGYIQGGIRVQVTGKVGRQYRIRLSDAMISWLPEEFAQLLPLDTPQPRSLTGSIVVSGTNGDDIVNVSLSQRLPYLTDQLINPAAVVVDVFGATSNTNWITHQLSARGIKSVSWDQVAAEHYRLTIALNYDQHWGYDVGYEQGSNLRIRIRRPPKIANQDSVLASLTIAVDAGHGGDNNGAFGSTGVLEKEINLTIASHLDSLLKSRGARVVMTRSADTPVGMLDRMDAVVNSRSHILVSIHCNSIGETSDPEAVKGTSTYYRYVGYQPLANIMYEKMLELGLSQFGVVGSFNFTLSGPTQLPNVLVETAFLSNPEDEMKLMDDGFRQAIAGKIVEGIEGFVKAYGSK
ncbi:MAG: N-acetylmuramoyl-L-alanine amidase [Bacteroidota bacterium]